MESVCINCKHFVQGCTFIPSRIWGNCMKPKEGTLDTESSTTSCPIVLADKTCDDYEPKKTSVVQRNQDFS